MTLHKVQIGEDVHAYRPNSRWTLCGLDKKWQTRVGTAVDCTDCIDTARSEAIRRSDRECGLDGYPELRMVR